MFQKMKSRKGFTLIEMLVVIAIIAILVAIIVPVVGNSTLKANAAADAANLRSFATTIAVDYLDNQEVDDSYTSPVCKSTVAKGKTITAYVHNGNVECFFEGGYGVDYFADVAANGEKATKTAVTIDNTYDEIWPD